MLRILPSIEVPYQVTHVIQLPNLWVDRREPGSAPPRPQHSLPNLRPTKTRRCLDGHDCDRERASGSAVHGKRKCAYVGLQDLQKWDLGVGALLPFQDSWLPCILNHACIGLLTWTWVFTVYRRFLLSPALKRCFRLLSAGT